jgi:hypothetical protein
MLSSCWRRPRARLSWRFDVVERLDRELSLRFRVLGVLESLPKEAERALGLEHAGGRLPRDAE